MNTWSGAELFSVLSTNGFLNYGGPYLAVKVKLMTRLSWQIDVNYQIVSDQVTDNWKSNKERNRTHFFLVAITNR